MERDQTGNGTGSATSRVGMAKSTEVAIYRSFLRLLPCRVYSAILTAIWETVPTGQRSGASWCVRRAGKFPGFEALTKVTLTGVVVL